MEIEYFFTRVDEIAGTTLNISPKVREENIQMMAAFREEEDDEEGEADTYYIPQSKTDG